jgi:hydroxymethylpyrimidine pyrophosphatase-like HAD family hydrolase
MTYDSNLLPLPSELLDTEWDFYRRYPWCLNAVPPMDEVVGHLRREVDRLDQAEAAWQRVEIMTNVFLLSCAVSDTVADYLVGDGYDLSQVGAVVPLVGPAVRAVEKGVRVSRKVRALRVAPVRRWREQWDVAVGEFLKLVVAAGTPDRDSLARAGGRLASLLATELPADLQRRRPRIPAAFRTQDLTHFDILELGRMLAAACPDRQRPVLIVGLRTAGSYFAPLLRASLVAEGYDQADAVTIRPKKGIGPWEQAVLARSADRGGVAAVVDEPANTGSTLAQAAAVVRKAGFAASNVVALVPVHPTCREWTSGHEFLALSGIRVLSLEPERWYKRQLLEPAPVEGLLAEYFTARKYSVARVVASARAEELNAQLQRRSEEKFHTRLKRIYELRLQNGVGSTETRYVLAKSVGWGWLGYHAITVGARLSEFVPPVLGLRDGILYTEWLPQKGRTGAESDRDHVVNSAASYVAARVRSLGLGNDPAPDLVRNGQHKGFDLLAGALGRAYGWKPAALLKRGRIQRELSRQSCPVPILIDGKMRPEEWVTGAGSLLKTDFEHHGLGKTELNMTDPAYDLAETSLFFRLSELEERHLIDRYVSLSGDTGVTRRLFCAELMAGTWAMKTALDNLGDARLAHRHEEFNRQYIDAWNFLTVHTLRLCASVCRRPDTPRWGSPLVVLDIDGVLDKQIFGFPSTTAAGIRAVSLLHAHDVAVAVNTARTVPEVKEYCSAYGFAGGVAEYGGAAWDAVRGRERVLVSDESLRQLERVRDALRTVPGLFLNDDYRYSIRAYTYERGRTAPLPTTLIRNMLADLKADRLAFHQTFLDTAVVGKDTDKGRGLHGLLALTGSDGLETIAIGDSEPDLAMFHAARRSFAPSNISCRSLARLLGCRIADRPYQLGLLRIVQSLVHPGGGRCDRCGAPIEWPTEQAGLFWPLLEAADQSRPRLLLRALFDPAALQVFSR